MANEKFDIDRLSPAEQEALVRTVSKGLSSSEGYGYGHGQGAEENTIHLRDLWRTVRKHRWMIVVLALIVTTIVTVEAFRTKTIYQSSATVEIGKDSATTLIKSGDFLLQSDDSDSIKTKMLFIKSRPVLEDVVVNLRLDENKQFLDVTERKSVIEAVQTIASRLSPGESQVIAPLKAATETESRSEINLARTPEEKARLTPYVKILGSNIAVEQIPDTRALVISFSHTDPALAATVANGVADAFIQRAYLNKTENFTRTSDWLNESTRRLETQMQKAEQELANYTRANNIFSTEGKSSLTTDKLVGLHTDLMKAETDRIIKQSLYEEVRQGRVAQLPEAFSDVKTVELQKKLSELSVAVSQMNVKYGPENPKVVETQQQIRALQEQIALSRKNLEDKLYADYQRAVRDEASLSASVERAKGEAVRENQANVKFNILKQGVQTATALYTDFLQKTNQAKVQEIEQHKNVRIIEPAQLTTTPSGPKRLRAILIGLFLSLASGIGLAFFMEYLDNTVKSVDDVTRYTQLPTLAIIPVIAAAGSRMLSGRKSSVAINSGSADKSTLVTRLKPGQVMVNDTRSAAAEAYRVLRTSLLLSSAGRPPQKVLITSAQPGEGKTTTIVNTAISLAQLGSSVLIIDCDLRKPSAHKVFGVNFTHGLSTYLSREVPIADLIHETHIPNLSLLPCGPIPPNPAELLSSERMKNMLRLLSEHYDHILIDSPPLINVADPVVLSTLVDGVIMVIQGGKATRDAVRRARGELAGVGAKVFGVVLNNLDLRKEGYSDYYYYYYNNYSYGHKADKGAEV
ncbi:MAG TPA: polysaccharide biosynthesis tyrosine autokinase [Blastocatellia bacterium]|nr:polysaccharide biosynthesis tyrosine autokinase [Blastocatellia bacterium]